MTVGAGRLSPSTLMAILQPWAEVAESIDERIARLADGAPGCEALWVGCGSGRSVLWWAERFGTRIEGVDPDARAIETADAAARDADLARLVTLQASDAENLPHEADVFDLTVVNMLYLSGADGREVFAQAARVARPMSVVVVLVPSWFSAPAPADVADVAKLGIRPHLLVEWKNYMREAGLVELTVEDAAHDGRWIAPEWLGLLIRGWRAARWRGVGIVLGREMRSLRKLARTRVLGLSMIRGTRWPYA